MSFFKYITSFLYERNWHTGKRELSTKKLIVTLGLVGVLLFMVMLAWWLQTPAEYVRVST